MTSLAAISPIDGRYYSQLQGLSAYFSEYALIKYRMHVEVNYFLFLAEKGFFKINKPEAGEHLVNLAETLTEDDAKEIKAIEKVTNHDVKAVEYFLKEKLKEYELSEFTEWVHFGLTSQDINNTAIPLLWKDALELEYMPAIANLVRHIEDLAKSWKHIPLLAHTHGQPASPTLLGKEFMVFAERLDGQFALLLTIPYAAKFGGATGNFNAHHVAFPGTDWVGFAREFVHHKLGLERMKFTTQVEHYDYLSAHFDCLKRINTILIDFCRDIWQYISMDYFKQKTKKNEVGSSAMPHKVNPIDFENAEGNLGIANALFEHFSAKLPISRLQRDLTDSTVLRNIGVPFAHTILALLSIEKGLKKLILNERRLHEDLENNWAVVAEGIQTVLRRENYPNPYEALKELTRGKTTIGKEEIENYIYSLTVSDEVKQELLKITPHNYTGVELF